MQTHENSTHRGSKYTNDPDMLHQIDLICAHQTTKAQAAAALGFKSEAVFNVILNRTGHNVRVRQALNPDNAHQFKSALTTEQKSALDAAVHRAAGLKRTSLTSKAKVWEQDAKDLIGYVRFCALVKKAEAQNT